MRASPIRHRFWHRVTYQSNGCWEWEGSRTKLGYGSIKRSRGDAIPAHRAAWELCFGSIPDGLDVLHHCDNRACVRPDHLFVGTHLDNMRDMMNKKRNKQVSGEKHPFAKLSDADVIALRNSCLTGQSATSQANKFGISVGYACRIIRGESRKSTEVCTSLN